MLTNRHSSLEATQRLPMSDQEVDCRDRRMDSISAAEEMKAAHANSVLSKLKLVESRESVNKTL